MTDDITISTTGFSRIVHRDTTALDDKLHKPTKIQPKGNNININGKKGVKSENDRFPFRPDYVCISYIIY